MDALEIHPRVFARHPELSKEDVVAAWSNVYYEAVRPESPNFPEYLWIGRDAHQRDIEMVGVRTETGWLVYHANTPLSRRTRVEVEKARRRGR